MGGTILKHLAAGDRVHIVVVCCGDVAFEHKDGVVVTRDSRRTEFGNVVAAYSTAGQCTGEFLGFVQDSLLDTVPIRDIVNAIEVVQDEFQADIWYVPGMSFHQDHRRVYEACASAARPTRVHVPSEIYAYETPLYSWNPSPWKMSTHVYENIESHLDSKIDICSLYQSQLREGVLSIQHIREYSVAAGVEAGLAAAERFEVLRIIRK